MSIPLLLYYSKIGECLHTFSSAGFIVKHRRISQNKVTVYRKYGVTKWLLPYDLPNLGYGDGSGAPEHSYFDLCSIFLPLRV